MAGQQVSDQPATDEAGELIVGIYNQLYVRRLKLGLSQREVTARIGMHQSQLSNYETGKVSPSLPCLVRWATAVDMKLTLITLEAR